MPGNKIGHRRGIIIRKDARYLVAGFFVYKKLEITMMIFEIVLSVPMIVSSALLTVGGPAHFMKAIPCTSLYLIKL